MESNGCQRVYGVLCWVYPIQPNPKLRDLALRNHKPGCHVPVSTHEQIYGMIFRNIVILEESVLTIYL